jgi:alkanesulfonate monooxygenase SsuD/methylene tetrahydromethanopterin reductase-like flavin-dependent oxidoreductase (luciferase family)
VVDFCDGWFPRGGPNFEAADGMARLGAAAEVAGRQMSSLLVSVFRAPPEKAELEKYAEAGITRAVFALPSEDRDTVLRQLDEYAPLLDRS